MGKTMRAIGLMSGTSMDGIDVALIDTDGHNEVKRGPAATVAYSDAFRGELRAALADAQALTDRAERPGGLARVEAALTDLHAVAIAQFLADQRIDPAGVDLIGFHGHTVLHKQKNYTVTADVQGGDRYENRFARVLTVQIGDGARLAQQTGIDVVYDLRAADAAAGGQGAPLAPVYHRALAAKLPERPAVVLNIGGVANVTWIGRHGDLIAFDTGPGNALLDDWMQRRCGQARDDDGRLAATGRVDDDALIALMTNGYFGRVPPKSLDRNAFSPAPVANLSPEDGAATLTAFTAASIASARAHFPEEPCMWLVCGGGRRNKTLMGMIAERVEAALAPIEAAGADGDAVEAEAWGYLAVRSLKKMPITFPGTTGVAQPTTGGVLARKS